MIGDPRRWAEAWNKAAAISPTPMRILTLKEMAARSVCLNTGGDADAQLCRNADRVLIGNLPG
jgi:hypothetical protein